MSQTKAQLIEGSASSQVSAAELDLKAQGDLKFSDSDSSNWVALQSASVVSSNVTWTLPSADGTSGQVLGTNGSGILSWLTKVVLDAAQTFTAAQRGAVSSLTSASTVTADFAVSNNFSLTLGHNVTLANPTNQTAGQSGTIVITQASSGGPYTVSYGSNWKFPGGTVPSKTATASSVCVLVYYVESASRITAQMLNNVTV